MTRATPDRSAADVDTVLTINGVGFDTDPTVDLVLFDGSHYAASSLRADSPSRITATFSAGTVPADLTHRYTVEVAEPGSPPVQLVEHFQMDAAGATHLEANLILPAGLRL